MLIIVSRDNMKDVIKTMQNSGCYKCNNIIEGFDKGKSVGLMFNEVEESKEMKKTFSIAKEKLDIRKLDDKIEQFKKEEGHEPYIFMSEGSLDEFEGGWGYMAMYTGCRVFKDNKKKYGEVELR